MLVPQPPIDDASPSTVLLDHDSDRMATSYLNRLPPQQSYRRRGHGFRAKTMLLGGQRRIFNV